MRYSHTSDHDQRGSLTLLVKRTIVGALTELPVYLYRDLVQRWHRTTSDHASRTLVLSHGLLGSHDCTEQALRCPNANVSTQIQRLRTAIQDYDNDRWRFISSKVGSGFSAAACKAKAEEIEAEDMEAEVGAESGSEDDRHNTFGRQDIEEEDQNEEEEQ